MLAVFVGRPPFNSQSAVGARLTHAVVGNETRKAVADGFPVENVIASDLRAGEIDRVSLLA
jgi:hypothetical protein